MKRKIKITESQYNILKQSLVETAFGKLATSNIKVGDTIVETGNSGTKSSFKVLQSFAGQITMEGISPDVVKYIYTITSDSLHGNILSGYYIDKQSYEQNPKNIKDWLKINKKITDFQVFRGNNLIDAADFNGKSSIGTNLPTQAGSNLPAQKNNGAVVPYSSSTSNGLATTNNETPPNGKKPYEKEYYPFEEIPDDTPPDAKPTPEDNEKVDRIVNTLNGKDPVLQKLFFKQASWWDTLNAELRGKKATHGGITATYDLLNNYVRNYVDKETPGFTEGKTVYYTFLEPVSLKYQGKKKQNLSIPANTKAKGIVLGLEFGDSKRIIKNEGTPEYYITVKGPTTKANIYNCSISLVKSSGNVIKQNIKIEFEESPGYMTVQTREKNKTK